MSDDEKLGHFVNLKLDARKAREQVERIESVLEGLYTDKSIRLDERWSAFTDTTEGKYHDIFIVHFPSLDAYGKYVNDEILRNRERHTDVDVWTIIEDLEYMFDQTEKDPTSNAAKRLLKYRNKNHEHMTRAILDEFKEDCLRQKVKSFTIDW